MKKIFICTNFRPFSGQPSCAYRGSEALKTQLREEIKHRGLDIEVISSVCMGHCPIGPNVKPLGESFIHEANMEKLNELLDRCEKMPP